MLPTVADVLAIPEVVAGRPLVLAGVEYLDRQVRWLHVSELPDISSMLRGGELILTTGIALPDSSARLREYVDALALVPASGLLIETTRTLSAVPDALVRACERAHLPLVQLRKEVPFVRVTEAVHAEIVQEGFHALNVTRRAHEVFTALCIAGADATEIVAETAKMATASVVFEDLLHRVIAFHPYNVAAEDLLANWTSRSRSVHTRQPTEFDATQGWSVTMVEAQGNVFGRLVIIDDRAHFSAQQAMIAERAAIALTLTRLLAGSSEVLEDRSHTDLLTDIRKRRFANEHEIHARTAALGVPTEKMALVAIAVRRVDNATLPFRSERDARAVASLIRSCGIRTLASTASDFTIDVLLPLSTEQDKEEVIGALARALHQKSRHRVLVGVGSLVRSLRDVARSSSEARQVLAAGVALGHQRDYYELPDVQLRGLLYTLADDPRLQSFAERMLGPLLEYDARQGTDLVAALEVYLCCRGNKSVAAAAAHMSRQAFYHRLATIERILAVDLESAEVCTSLHAAVMTMAVTRAPLGPRAPAPDDGPPTCQDAHQAAPARVIRGES